MNYALVWRSILGNVLFLFIFLSVIHGPLSTSHAARKIVVAASGAHIDTIKRVIGPRFHGKKDTTVSFVKKRGLLRHLHLQKRDGKLLYDVVFLDSRQALQACNLELLQPLDFKKDSPIPCAVATMAYAMPYMYRSGSLQKDPKSIADFFDVKRFPGRRGLKRSPYASLPWALLADGVPAKDVYKELGTASGRDRAIGKLKQIEGDVVWWDTPREARMLASDPKVAMTAVWSTDVPELAKNNSKLRQVWNGSLRGAISCGIPVGRPKDAAADFIRFSISPEVQAAISKQSLYGPAPEVVNFQCASGTCPCSGTNTCSKSCCSSLGIAAAFWVKHGEDIRHQFDKSFP